MIRNKLTHKRETSESIQSFLPRPQHKSMRKKVSHKGKSKIYSLVTKSSNTIPYKQTMIESLDMPAPERQNTFFAFGRGTGPRKWQLDMEEINEVQDSNSRREITSHRSQTHSKLNKQNYFVHNSSVLDEQHNGSFAGKSKKSRNKPKSQKNYKSAKNSKTNCTRSTISLSRIKSRVREPSSQLQKSMKMIWECMGELWENTRVSQYRSQRNGEGICELRRKLEQQEKKLLQLKFDLSLRGDNNRCGLRS